ncbi:MAG: ATP synthase F1 subunit delta [Anaerolineales bacterium]|nr:MAG: ATP synthase F1 subunit delta [Anaerolineales bacterium]
MSAAKYSKGEELAQTYAQAAYQHTTQGWLSGLNAVHERLAADAGLLADLDNIDVGFEERQARLDGLLSSDVQPDVRNFLYLLLREGHLGLLGDVIADLTRFSTRGPEAQIARITSAVPLTSDEKEAFRQRVHARFGPDVDLDFRVDSSALGGAIVQVGDKIIDGSVAGKLNALHERLAALR